MTKRTLQYLCRHNENEQRPLSPTASLSKKSTVGQSVENKEGFWGGPCFTEFFILACWNIWKQRNGLIFNGTIPSLEAGRLVFS